MIVRVSVTYYDENFKKAKESPELWAALREVFPSLPEDAGTYSSINDELVDLDLVGEFLESTGIGFTIKPVKHNIFRKTGTEERLKKMEREMKLLRFQAHAGDSVAQIHVPNIGLLMVNEVEVREDLCTHALQTLLDEGWRILAICPSIDQRRPDYILGRHNPKSSDVSWMRLGLPAV